MTWGKFFRATKKTWIDVILILPFPLLMAFYIKSIGISFGFYGFLIGFEVRRLFH